MDLRRNQAGELARFPQHGDDETPFLAQVRNVPRVKAIVRGGFAGRACQPGGLDLLRSEARERTPFCGGEQREPRGFSGAFRPQAGAAQQLGL